MNERRRFSQRERTELFLSTGGVCAKCGEPLPSNFHVDHIRPWSCDGPTEIANAEPLCPTCNLKKGVNMLLDHQVQFQNACRELKASTTIRKIIGHVICGGGKSVYGPIATHELIPYLADGICWVTPRRNLRIQAEEIFGAPWLRSILGHQHEIRQAINEANPIRDTIGYCTTYSALAEAAQLRRNPHIATFQNKRMILLLDEPNHVCIEEKTFAALKPLHDMAAVVIIMGGHLTRHDDKCVAFLDYLPMDDKRRSYVNIENNERQRFVRYTLQQATRDRQLIKINFELRDASAAWSVDTEHNDSVTVELDSFVGASRKKTSLALMTALSTEFAKQILIEAAEFWLQRRRNNPRSKFIVVCARISHAKACVPILRRMGVDDFAIATSDDGDEAEITIKRFRGVNTPNLASIGTVGMAYEGMNCPEADVLACLTHIRSREWIEQMLHRVTRFDRHKAALPWEQQFATIFAPRDRFFLEIMEEIKADQAPYVEEHIPSPPPPRPPPGGGAQPLGSAMGERSAHTFGDAAVAGKEYADIDEDLKRAGLIGALSHSDAKKLHDVWQQPRNVQQSDIDFSQPAPPTPSQREATLRKRIVSLQRSGYRPEDPSTHEIPHGRGRKIWKMFSKGLDELTEQQLEAVWEARRTWV